MLCTGEAGDRAVRASFGEDPFTRGPADDSLGRAERTPCPLRFPGLDGSSRLLYGVAQPASDTAVSCAPAQILARALRCGLVLSHEPVSNCWKAA